MARDFLERLAARRIFGIRPGLETMEALCEALGHPEREVAVIHIAGTNGKGSVAALCEAALRVAGYPVGRYTSPHLMRVNERFLIYGEEVSDEALGAALDTVERVCAEQKLEPTFFEVLTACAWVLFREAGVKIAVMEVGMGGRWDATNVIEAPLVSVIPHIALDHCAILGETLEAVAAEKAGIIKSGRPLVMGAMAAEAKAVLCARAAALGAPVFDAEEEITVKGSRRTLHGQVVQCTSTAQAYPEALTRLTGTFQTENIATALCTVERLNAMGITISEKAFVEALRTVQWPGRCQLIATEPPTILDGGHNPDALQALCASLKSLHIRRRVALVCGFCGDKSVKAALQAIAPIVESAWTVPIANPRTLPAEETAALARLAGIRHVIPMTSVNEAIETASNWAQQHQGTVLICGSLYLVGEVLALRGDGGDEATLDPGESIRVD